MRSSIFRRRMTAIAAAAAFLLVASQPVSAAVPSYAACSAQDPATSTAQNDAACYAVPLDPPGTYSVTPLLSVGDTAPRTSNPAQQAQMVGIPDGLGITRLGGHRAAIYMNHEFTGPTLSTPIIGSTQYRGAYVTVWQLDDEHVVAGDVAYAHVYSNDAFVGPTPRSDNATPAFSRFCSATLSGRDEGYDRTIFFTNEEESTSAATFDTKGGESVAIFDNEAHALPDLGHFSKETDVTAPDTKSTTVIFSMEDGPAGANSQLYMYVGEKQKNGSVLVRNGLSGGTLYVFVSDDSTRQDESTFVSGSIPGHWEAIPGAGALDAAALEAASDAKHAFGFVRIEDGTFDAKDPGRFFFVTTGDVSAASYNNLGRIYELAFDRRNPTGPTTLTLRVNADTVIAGGGDTAISPDNVGAYRGTLMVSEDGTGTSRPVMASKNRDGSIWRFDTTTWSQSRIVELDPPGRDGIAVGAGIWETSGTVSARSVFGKDSWIFDVQAHPPTTAPGVNTVEDGQLLVMQGVREHGEDEDDD